MFTVLKTRRWSLGILLIFLLAVSLRLLLLSAWYTDSYDRFQSGDYTLYRIGAEHLRDQGDHSNSLFLVRPPAFMWVVLALNGNHTLVLLVNALLGALIAPLTCVLARLLNLPESVSLLAGLLVAVDPSSIVFSTFLGPEPLANLTLVGAVGALLWAVVGDQSHPYASLAWGSLAGVALGLSALARPAPYLLWIVLAGWMLVLNRKRWPAIGSFVTLAVTLIALWIAHNARTFDYATFSTIGPYTMTYYRAASVEHLGSSHDMDTVYTDINRRVEAYLNRGQTDVGPEARHGYLAATPEVADALNRVSIEIFKEYPLIYLATFPVGLVRMFGLLSNDLFHTSSPLKLAERAWNAGFAALALLGVWQAYRQKQWLLFWCVVLLAAYFIGGTLLMKSAGMSARERSMLTPFMALAGAYAIHWQFQHRLVKSIHTQTA